MTAHTRLQTLGQVRRTRAASSGTAAVPASACERCSADCTLSVAAAPATTPPAPLARPTAWRSRSRCASMRRCTSAASSHQGRVGCSVPVPSARGMSDSRQPRPSSFRLPVSCSKCEWCSRSAGRCAIVMQEMPASLATSNSRLSISFPTAEVHSSRIAKRGWWYSSLAMLRACCSPSESSTSQSISSESVAPSTRETAPALACRSTRYSRST
mmetsp:Transcript_2504/g.7410  ORF Transcript_2504/g.7410 Transcript_2504/m.7410 type:complete len:213 (+) Transcript_2504:1116-1754(+)